MQATSNQGIVKSWCLIWIYRPNSRGRLHTTSTGWDPPQLRPNPANASRLSNIGSILVQCLRRWPNSEPTLDKRLVFAGKYDVTLQHGKLCTSASTIDRSVVTSHYNTESCVQLYAQQIGVESQWRQTQHRKLCTSTHTVDRNIDLVTSHCDTESVQLCTATCAVDRRGDKNVTLQHIKLCTATGAVDRRGDPVTSNYSMYSSDSCVQLQAQ